MQFFKKYIWGLAFFLSACSQDKVYNLDMSQWRSWNETLETNEQLTTPPYVVEFSDGSKTVHYVLVSNNPANKTKQTKMIETMMARPHDIVIEQRGANQPDDALIVKNLESFGYSKKDYFFSHIIEILNQRDSFHIHTHHELMAKTKDVWKQVVHDRPVFKNIPFSIKDFAKWVEEKSHMKFTAETIKDGVLVAPIDSKDATPLQTLSFRIDQIFDEAFLEKITKALNDPSIETILVIRAHSKFVTERKVLEKMLDAQPALVKID